MSRCDHRFRLHKLACPRRLPAQVWPSCSSRECHYLQSTSRNVALQRFYNILVNQKVVVEIFNVFPYPAYFCCEQDSRIWMPVKSQPRIFNILSQMPRATGYWSHKNSAHRYKHWRGASTCKPEVRRWNVVYVPFSDGINLVKPKFCARTSMEGDSPLWKFLKFVKFPNDLPIFRCYVLTCHPVGNPDSWLQINYLFSASERCTSKAGGTLKHLWVPCHAWVYLFMY